MTTEPKRPLNFIQDIIESDNAARKWGVWPGGDVPKVHTRFPPEPNGYLHIGHAKSICLNFGLAERYGGKCNLRFDDTNPVKEEQEYIDSIIEDVKWLGFDWEDRLFYASDYFERMYAFAVELINKGKAFVCDLTGAQTSEYRGTLTAPGRNSPFRDRSVDENLDLFSRMRKGEFPDGSRTLRAKIDMASSNMNLRDPVMYRILHASHPRTDDAWCVYPMYDWAHGLEDSIEGITHSICTLEFEDHRPLYNWYIDAINEGRRNEGTEGCKDKEKIHHPRQIEFARLELTHTMMSKRKLLELVKGGHVRGWDDPRMPTLSALRRRGYTPSSIQAFATDVGVAKQGSVIDVVRLKNAIRGELNKTAPRRMAVLRPLRVVIENYPEDQTEELDAVNNPEDADMGTRKVPFSRVLYLERGDFMEDPPRKFFRLAPGREVRLRYAYFITCQEAVKDADGNVVELRCTYDPATRGGDSPDGRKVKATLHWVSAEHAIEAEVRLYDHLFVSADPGDVPPGQDYKAGLNPNSLEVVTARVEPSLASASVGDRVQFERHGYFVVDPDSHDGPHSGPYEAPAPAKVVFNRTVTLRDTWAKIAKKAGR